MDSSCSPCGQVRHPKPYHYDKHAGCSHKTSGGGHVWATILLWISIIAWLIGFIWALTFFWRSATDTPLQNSWDSNRVSLIFLFAIGVSILALYAYKAETYKNVKKYVSGY